MRACVCVYKRVYKRVYVRVVVVVVVVVVVLGRGEGTWAWAWPRPEDSTLKRILHGPLKARLCEISCMASWRLQFAAPPTR